MSGPGDAGLFVGWCFPVFFFGGGGVGPVLGSVPPPPFFVLFVVCVWGVVVGTTPLMRLDDRHRCLRSSQYVNLTLSA